jgi:hypothetical protein
MHVKTNGGGSGGGPATLRGMAGAAGGGGGQAGGAAPAGAHTGGGGGDGDGDDIDPAGLDPKRLYNESRKMQRLLQKKDQELAALRGEFEPIKKRMSRFDALFAPEEQQEEGEAPLTAYDQAMRAHQRALDADPESSGIPLTVNTAKEASEALKIARAIQAENEELKKKLGMVEKPMYHAEQMLFVNLDGALHDAVTDLFQDEGLANENFADFERVAIGRLSKLKKEQPMEYQRLVRSAARQDAFVQEVIKSKIPRAYGKRGAEGIVDEYSVEAATADMTKAMSMKSGPERAALMKKARVRLLPETLGVDIPKR